MAFGVHCLDPHFVLAARQPDEDYRVASAVVRPLPREIVERDVQVSDSRRDVAGGSPADGNNAQVLQAVRNEDDALGEGAGKRWQHGEDGRRFVLGVDEGALRECAGDQQSSRHGCNQRLDERGHCGISVRVRCVCGRAFNGRAKRSSPDGSLRVDCTKVSAGTLSSRRFGRSRRWPVAA